MTPSSLLELADRVEQASGPDRELDEAIAVALDWSPIPNPTNAGGLVGRWRQPDGNMSGMEGPPQWCASLDAAMSLVPEGWRVGTLGEHANEPVFSAVLMARRGRYDSQTGEAATLALSLTAACLRALAGRGE